MAYFTANWQYHEKYHAQQLLPIAVDVPFSQMTIPLRNRGEITIHSNIRGNYVPTPVSGFK
jgi:hypothetical protein